MKQLTLTNFLYEHFQPQLISALENMELLTYLSISNNNLESLTEILSFFDGHKHSLEELDLSNNPITLDQQIILAKWIAAYPKPIKIQFNSTNELDVCIIKGVYHNSNIRFFSNSVFQTIRTPMDQLQTILAEMKHEERFIPLPETKRSCIIC